ncbi:MAG: helix-turn-helix domain-containing protein [Candidatus Omnitrophota bacterium]
MAEEKMLTVRQAAAFLGISEKAVIDLSDKGLIPAYKVGGVYLRFKKEQLKGINLSPEVLTQAQAGDTAGKFSSGLRGIKDRVVDFFYFNDFYFLCLIICLALLFIVLKT